MTASERLCFLQDTLDARVESEHVRSRESQLHPIFTVWHNELWDKETHKRVPLIALLNIPESDDGNGYV